MTIMPHSVVNVKVKKAQTKADTIIKEQQIQIQNVIFQAENNI